MKKLYAVASLALAVSLSCAAAPFTKELSKPMKFDEVVKLNSEALLKADAPRKAAPLKTPATQEDVYGPFVYAYNNVFDDSQVYASLMVESTGVANQVKITGFFYDYPVLGTVDLAAGTITIKSGQVLIPGFAPISNTETEDLKLFLCENVNGSLVEADEAVFYFSEGDAFSWSTKDEVLFQWQGSHVWYTESNVYFFATIDSYLSEMRGWALNWLNVTIPLNKYYEDTELWGGEAYFEYHPGNWDACDEKATMIDGWVAPAYGVDLPAFDVDVQLSRLNNKHVLIMNPYKNASFDDINDSKEDGYIFLDITDPDCVLVRPMVYSGFYNEDIGMMFNTDDAGMKYYLQGYSFEEIKLEAEDFGDPLGTMTEDGVVTLPKCQLEPVYDLGYSTVWIDQDENPVPMEAQFTLPENIVSGVEGIIADEANLGKAEFYNLQGVKVAAPAAGEVVIVKKGGKTFKTIAR